MSKITVVINGAVVEVEEGTSVAVAAALALQACRTSVTGQPRGPLCAMGICFECRMTINGQPQSRTCQVVCEPNMDVRTSGS